MKIDSSSSSLFCSPPSAPARVVLMLKQKLSQEWMKGRGAGAVRGRGGGENRRGASLRGQNPAGPKGIAETSPHAISFAFGTIPDIDNESIEASHQTQK